MADLIVVLDGARVVEAGTHDALMARGGQYAQLYGIQARGVSVERGAGCEVRGARVRGARCEVRGARCEVRGARCGAS